MHCIGIDLDLAVSLLTDGKLVAIPTETVYGLAANGLAPEAIANIYIAKNRPQFNPLILHCKDTNALHTYGVINYILEQRLIDAFMPGPLTILLPKKPVVPDIVTAGSDYVALRVPKNEIALQLLNKLPFPLAAPSANPSGFVSPTCAQHVASQLGDKINYIIDGGISEVGIESTIVQVTGATEVLILRPGSITAEDIMAATNAKVTLAFQQNVSEKVGAIEVTPGSLASHYAPNTPLILTDDINDVISKYGVDNVGAIVFKDRYDVLPDDRQLVLSKNGNLTEAAHNLFACLRAIDGLKVKVTIISLVQNKGIGIAINDRLKRAATPK